MSTYVLSHTVRPLPTNPRLHSHTYDPWVLAQVALAWQSCKPRSHSSTSGHSAYAQSQISLSVESEELFWLAGTQEPTRKKREKKLQKSNVFKNESAEWNSTWIWCNQWKTYTHIINPNILS